MLNGDGGDGGDESLIDYIRYKAMKAADYFDLIPGPVKRGMLAFVECLPKRDAPKDIVRRSKRFPRPVVFGDLPKRHLTIISFFREEEKDAIYSEKRSHEF